MNRASTFKTKRFRPNKSRKGYRPLQRPNKPPVAKVNQSADHFNHYNRLGHWRRNCPKYLKEVKDKKGKGTLFVTQACLVTDSINSWIVDSGATNHVYCSLQGFKETRALEPGKFSFTWGNGATVSTKSSYLLVFLSFWFVRMFIMFQTLERIYIL